MDNIIPFGTYADAPPCDVEPQPAPPAIEFDPATQRSVRLHELLATAQRKLDMYRDRELMYRRARNWRKVKPRPAVFMRMR